MGVIFNTKASLAHLVSYLRTSLIMSVWCGLERQVIPFKGDLSRSLIA